MKKMINERDEVDINYESIDSIIKVLEKYKGKNAALDIYAEGCIEEIVVEYERLETDEEERVREKKESQYNIKQKALKKESEKFREVSELEMYKKLKEKYGDIN